MRDDIELHSFGQRAALPDGHNVTLFDTEARTAVSVDVLVTLLETTVLLDVVKVVPPHDNCALHLGGSDKALEDLAADGHVASEGALFVNIVPLDGGVRGLDSQSYVLDPTHGLNLLRSGVTLAGDEDGILRLVCLFVLYRVPPPHESLSNMMWDSP
jgi:hypothetical protein